LLKKSKGDQRVKQQKGSSLNLQGPQTSKTRKGERQRGSQKKKFGGKLTHNGFRGVKLGEPTPQKKTLLDLLHTRLSRV